MRSSQARQRRERSIIEQYPRIINMSKPKAAKPEMVPDPWVAVQTRLEANERLLESLIKQLSGLRLEIQSLPKPSSCLFIKDKSTGIIDDSIKALEIKVTQLSSDFQRDNAEYVKYQVQIGEHYISLRETWVKAQADVHKWWMRLIILQGIIGIIWLISR